MPKRIKTISEFHKLRGFPKPEHPLISVINVTTINSNIAVASENLVLDFYIIALKRVFSKSKLKYGQQEYDFNEGLMSFISPNQVFSVTLDNTNEIKQSGYVLLIHPNLLWNTSLAKTIKEYEYFNYSINEALFLSEKEEKTVIGII